MRRIGIYSGTFNPVHSGHVSFALQSVKAAKLNEIYFLPERRPRGKSGVEHFGHRVAMLNNALKPYRKLKVLELPDVEFNVARTLPKLQQMFAGAHLVFMVGSDVIDHINEWPNIKKLFDTCELVIGVRHGSKTKEIKARIESWLVKPGVITMFESFAPKVSSSKVRETLGKRQTGNGLLTSVERYSNKHWLYVSLT